MRGVRVSGFRLLTERQPQRPAEPRRRLALIGAEPDGHAAMPGLRLGNVGAEQPVPDRQIETVIGIVLAAQHRVVHAMHVGRHDEEPHDAVEPLRQRDIGVIEHGAGIEDHLEQEHGEGCGAERHHHHDLPQHRQPDLDGVKADRRGHVDVTVGMVHLVQAPKQRNLVRGPMLRPDGEVEHDQRNHDFDPSGPRHLVQEPDPMRFGVERSGDGSDRHGEHDHEPEQDCAGHADAEIGEPAPPLGDQ